MWTGTDSRIAKAAGKDTGCLFCAPGMGALLEVKVLPQAGHSERSEAQLREGDRAWRGSVERSCEPMDKNRITRRCRAGRAGKKLRSSCGQGEAA
jgi:hypothetical protein